LGDIVVRIAPDPGWTGPRNTQGDCAGRAHRQSAGKGAAVSHGAVLKLWGLACGVWLRAPVPFLNPALNEAT